MRQQLALGLSLLALAGLASMGGCADAESQNCTKASQCNELNGETVEQCQANAFTCISLLGQADQSCQALGTAITNYDNCMAGLSCSDRADTSNSCSKEATAMATAQTAATTSSCPCTSSTSPY